MRSLRATAQLLLPEFREIIANRRTLVLVQCLIQIRLFQRAFLGLCKDISQVPKEIIIIVKCYYAKVIKYIV